MKKKYSQTYFSPPAGQLERLQVKAKTRISFSFQNQKLPSSFIWFPRKHLKITEARVNVGLVSGS